MKITFIVGARPNFMKVAPVIQAIKRVQLNEEVISYRLVHTGQHYDHKMSDAFFEDLDIPLPDINLGCGGGTQAEQTAAIMIAFEQELLKNPTDLVIVVGDVTSTMACTIVAKKLNVKVAHVEAGIRSYDLGMPEEINRMVTDSICDYFFTTSEIANENLRRTGIPDERIFFVGNVMIDSLLQNQPRFRKPPFFDGYGLSGKNYFVLTMHRPSNVDEPHILQELISSIVENSGGLPIIFPLHPRTAKLLNGALHGIDNLKTIDPLGYLEFNYLVENAKAVITDSGGITEETTVMGIPCLTLRNNTERPETITMGTNELVGNNPGYIKIAMEKVRKGVWKAGRIPPKWDGKAADRIVEHLLNF